MVRENGERKNPCRATIQLWPASNGRISAVFNSTHPWNSIRECRNAAEIRCLQETELKCGLLTNRFPAAFQQRNGHGHDHRLPPPPSKAGLLDSLTARGATPDEPRTIKGSRGCAFFSWFMSTTVSFDQFSSRYFLNSINIHCGTNKNSLS